VGSSRPRTPLLKSSGYERRLSFSRNRTFFANTNLFPIFLRIFKRPFSVLSLSSLSLNSICARFAKKCDNG
jgi:hypothetical protein